MVLEIGFYIIYCKDIKINRYYNKKKKYSFKRFLFQKFPFINIAKRPPFGGICNAVVINYRIYNSMLSSKPFRYVELHPPKVGQEFNDYQSGIANAA